MIGRPLALLLAGGVLAAGAVWSSRDAPSSEALPAPTPGAVLFSSKGCAACHDGPGSDSGFDVGPSLRDAATWAGSRVDGRSAEQYLTQSILDPQAVISPAAATGARMPTIAMSAEEVDALVAHLLAG